MYEALCGRPPFRGKDHVWSADGGVRPKKADLAIEDASYRTGQVVLATLGETGCYSWAKIEHEDSDAPPRLSFLRGDCNDDGEVDISDGVCILNWLFLGGPAPVCEAVANANGDAELNVADPSYLFNFLFLGGPPPAAPFPACGTSDTPLGCEETPAHCR